MQQAKHIFFLFICWLILTPSFSQQVYFNKTWGVEPIYFDGVYSTLEVNNNYYIACTEQTTDTNYVEYAVLHKLDSLGNIIKSYKLKIKDRPNGCIQNSLSYDGVNTLYLSGCVSSRFKVDSVMPYLFKTNLDSFYIN